MGDVWISKQNTSQDSQGTNIAIKSPTHADNELRVLGYVIRKGDQWTHNYERMCTLEEMVWSVLKSYGWYDEYCNSLLGR
jgi:hypothetical protein